MTIIWIFFIILKLNFRSPIHNHVNIRKRIGTSPSRGFETLTAKHTSISYDFNGITFEAYRGDAKGEFFPVEKIKITGKITITIG